MADLRILDGQVLDQGMYSQDWTPEMLAQVAQAGGFGDLWSSGYTPASGDPTNTLFDSDYQAARYSPELTAKLGEYNFYRTGQRPGETDRGRHLVATGADGQPIWDNTYSYSKWTDAPIEAARTLGSAYLGASAINGGLLGAGSAAGAEGAAGLAGGLELSGQMPVYQAMSSSQLPAIAGAAGGAAATTIPMGGYAGAGLEAGGTAAGVSSGGGLLNSALTKFAPGAAQFIKDNPLLARGLFSAATGLLSASGSGGGGGGGEPTFGPAKKWTTPIQQGLIGNPQLTDIAKPVSFKGRW
jgi:hypothetical protein